MAMYSTGVKHVQEELTSLKSNISRYSASYLYPKKSVVV